MFFCNTLRRFHQCSFVTLFACLCTKRCRTSGNFCIITRSVRIDASDPTTTPGWSTITTRKSPSLTRAKLSSGTGDPTRCFPRSPFLLNPALRYEKNKHVFPMVRWEVFDREKRFDRYTAKDGRQGDRINFAPTLPSATAAAAAGLIMPAAFLSVKALDAKANPKSKMWDDEAWRRYVLHSPLRIRRW